MGKTDSMLIDYNLTDTVITIKNSHYIPSCEMEDILQQIKADNTSDIFNKVSIDSMLDEWKAHNLIYELGMFLDRTAHVDITINPWYIRSIYFVAAKIYDLIF